MFVSLTRLRIRSLRFMPGFLLHTMGSLRQVRRAAGFRGGRLLADRRVFWTLTAWDSLEAMRAYMVSGAHRAAMPRLLDWCDEAAVAHWEQPETTDLPGWAEADRRLRQEGRPSKVRHPGPDQAGLRYAAPRLTAGGPISPVAR